MTNDEQELDEQKLDEQELDDEQEASLENSQEQDSTSNESGKGTPPSNLAKQSTGPRTERGKRVSSRNALKHAIFSKAVVLKGESQAEVDHWVLELRKYFQPQGALEDILVDKIVALFWRQRRVLIAEREAGGLDVGPFNMNSDPSQKDLLMRYDAMLDRNIDRALAQLERAQRMRLGQQAPPRIDVKLS
jgi:hypothetical protein